MDKQKYIKDAVDKLFSLWLRRTSAIGALIFLLLTFLDLSVAPEHFERFLGYRVAIAIFLLIISGLAGKTANKRTLQCLGLAAVAASAATVEVMILQTGGHHSPYSTGMIMLAVTALAFVPAGISFHSTSAVVIYGVYLIPILMTERIHDMPAFFTTNFFMCSIILTVLTFRYMSMQSLRQQLGTEYELTAVTGRLSESEERQRLLLQNANDAIYVHEISPEAPGRFIEVNDRACQMLGYTREEILEMAVSEIDVPDQAERVPYIFNQFEKTGSAVFETEHFTKDGRRVPVEVSTRLFNLQGRPTVLSVVRDISERKELEEKLANYQIQLEDRVEKRTAELEKTIAQLELEVNERKLAEHAMGRSRRLLDGVFESIQDGIAVLDTEHNIIMANNALGNYFGISEATGSINKKCFEVYNCAREQCERCVSAKAMSERSVQTETLAYNLEGNNEGYLEIFAFPFYGAEGEIRGVIQYLRDITERMRAEAALKENEERFKKLLDGAPIAISIVNRDGTVEYVNRKHPEIMGYDLEDIPTLEDWWSQAYPLETDREAIRASWYDLTRRLYQGEEVEPVDRTVVSKDGSIKELELRFKSLADKIIVAFGDITERKQAEEKLRASELHFRTLFEKAAEGIIFIDEYGAVLATNDSFAHMHGYSCDEILKMRLNELDTGKSFEQAGDRIRRLMEGESLRFEAEHRHSDGHTFPVEVSTTMVPLSGKDYFVAFHHDISERKKTERTLMEKEARMRAMLESFDGLIYICSPDYRIEFMNENLARRTGRSAIGELCHEVLNDRDSVCPWCVNERVLRGEVIRYEIQSPRDGRWYHVVNSPISYTEGSVLKLAMILDITERKKADIALRESEERYRRLISSVTDYIYTVTVKDGRPASTKHGDGCTAVTGYTPEHYDEDPDLWYRMVYDSDRGPVIEQAKKILNGERTSPLEHRIVHRGGSLRWVRHVMVPLFDKDHKLVSFDGLISDITDKKILEDKLEKARAQEERNLKVFSRTLIDVQEEERRAIARELHDEIGQSLTGLKFSVESIAAQLTSDQADYMKAMEISLGEMLGIVRNMSLDLRPAMLDDFGLVSTMNWYFERYRSQTGISVNFVQTGPERRLGPQKEIAVYRIMQEALTNAARYACVKSLLVELIGQQDSITLRVLDKGRGFDIENWSRSGSGLSIMRERAIIENGAFRLVSAPGQGTEVSATIPVGHVEGKKGENI